MLVTKGAVLLVVYLVRLDSTPHGLSGRILGVNAKR
jgi:hypothetical protein